MIFGKNSKSFEIYATRMEKWRRLSIRESHLASESEGNTLIENRVIWSKVVLVLFFFFFSSCYLPAWPMATTSSIECPFPSFISGNYHRLPSRKTISGTILIVPTYQEPFRAIRGYFIVPLSSNFYLYFSHPFPSLTNISLRSSKYDSVDFYVTIFRLESKAIDRKLRRFSNIPHAREI